MEQIELLGQEVITAIMGEQLFKFFGNRQYNKQKTLKDNFNPAR